MTLAEEWMPYRSGDSLLRLPSSEESAFMLEDLSRKGSVWSTGKWSHYVKTTLEAYRRKETLENVITHVQEKPNATIYFLKSYALESWIIRITNR